MFDTGSPMVYFLSDKCDKQLCPQEYKFAQSNSGTFKGNSDGSKEPLAHCYGQGCVSGAVSKDNVCFTEGDDKSCLATTFLSVDEATDIDKDKFSGIVGLGPKSDVARMPAFIEQVADLGGVGGGQEI
mmetsp:Transcript_42639/g.65393  ORF Transcript_42639/g.65393 Transcript_42639/m.65393 type:complete len:128 (+) Transcript_42639:415-798(+)